MNKNEIAEAVNEIFCDVLDNDSLMLTTEMTATDVEGWDSLTHINLVTSIEKFFKVRFSLAELDDFKNVGDILETVHKKVNK